ncbi:uncharacterized protein LOC111616470 [Centruroides sculpturatus]|uniref:uncharacterized protein LOC111616470 n=1 Tax=Centruroides sculpturatus TaxID=218467 RepID=UPI000C6E98CB|nr:uncharacterized protein LOC111616470 [Centruroides sculpturatus]
MNLAAKVNTRNNILQRLCGTTWGSSPSTLRISALGLVFSAAEYCAPVWMNSTHIKKLDAQLNATLRIITGTLKSTPIHWLPILSHIPPSALRRDSTLLREYRKILSNPQLPIHQDIDDLNINRLKSRHPPLIRAKSLHSNNFNLTESWKRLWADVSPVDSRQLPCITKRPPGFELSRNLWSVLNRIRTKHGLCRDSLFRWGKVASAQCDCGAERQTIHHILEDCPVRSFSGQLSDFLIMTEILNN